MHTVVVASGHLIDAPDRAEPRFPPSAEDTVAADVAALFAEWRLGAGDLVLCGGARGSDILFAEAALRRGAAVRLLLALPPDELVETSIALRGSDWEQRFRVLLAGCPSEVVPRLPAEPAGAQFARVNDRLVEEALRLAPVCDARGALVWDGKEGDAGGGTADMAFRLRRAGIPTVVIAPQRSVCANGSATRPS